jgi:hypothetical protein
VARRELISFCGLYCDLCDSRARIPARASALLDALVAAGHEHGAADRPGFEVFWTYLVGLAEADGVCRGCRAMGEALGCEISRCARERGVEICVFCGDYPCARVEEMLSQFPALRAEHARLRELGVDAWLEEQDERVCRGVCYSEICKADHD